MGMFDTFVAELRCPRCGWVSSADDSSGMQTKMRNEPALAWLTVGDELQVEHATMRESGYLPVQIQIPAEPIRILQIWSCSHCHHYPNWAEIVVRDGCIESITAVPLDLETLARVHYIEDEAMSVAAALADRDLTDLSPDETVPLLRQLLSMRGV
jgi:hypothetical protein